MINSIKELFWFLELRKKYNAQDSRCCAITAEPLFAVQSLEHVATVDPEYHYEGENIDTVVSRFWNLDGDIFDTEDDAKNYLIEYMEYKIDPEQTFEEAWEDAGGETGLGMSRYIDQAWYLTREQAQRHMEIKSHRYTKPRIFVQSMYSSWELTRLLRFLGMERR